MSISARYTALKWFGLWSRPIVDKQSGQSPANVQLEATFMLKHQCELLQAHYKGCVMTNVPRQHEFSTPKKFPDFYRLSRKSGNPSFSVPLFQLCQLSDTKQFNCSKFADVNDGKHIWNNNKFLTASARVNTKAGNTK